MHLMLIEQRFLTYYALKGKRGAVCNTTIQFTRQLMSGQEEEDPLGIEGFFSMQSI